MAVADKAPGAFKTIGELSKELGVAQHILRYWETKFPQLKPLQRAGNRRYYRPGDVELARKIHRWLTLDGYTVRGVQKMLRGKNADAPAEPEAQSAPAEAPQPMSAAPTGVDVERLIDLRDRLASALDS